MARGKSFVEDEIIDRLMRIFWKKGYVACSYPELTRASGLSKPSLYNAFGDKRSLFLKCIERCGSVVMVPLLTLLNDGTVSGNVALGNFLSALLSENDEMFDRFGCMYVNTLMEAKALRDRMVHKAAADFIHVLEKAICHRLVLDNPSDPNHASTCEKKARLVIVGIFGLRLRDRIYDGSYAKDDLVADFISKIVSG